MTRQEIETVLAAKYSRFQIGEQPSTLLRGQQLSAAGLVSPYYDVWTWLVDEDGVAQSRHFQIFRHGEDWFWTSRDDALDREDRKPGDVILNGARQ